MIPHVVFLLRDGLKAYFEWISQVLRSKHVPKLCTKYETTKKTYKICHLFFAAGAFSQKNVQKIMNNMIISKKSWKNFVIIVV